VRTFVCHECETVIRTQEDVTITCVTCGGWRLATLGVATGGVEEALSELGIPTFVIDGEHTNTKAKAEKVYRAWEEAPYGVLLGTEMAHNILEEADAICILSLDSLFALPEYKTDEKILHLVTEMTEKVKEQGVIIFQTRLIHAPVIKYITSHSFIEFYREELGLRRMHLLPPYYTVIKSTFHNVEESYKERINKEITNYHPLWYEAGSGKTLLFLHIEEAVWNSNVALRSQLKSILGLGEIMVNPLTFFS
jgi:primosomal protein N' (replication factor Y)